MADIGDKLRSARKAKGMSIEDVEKITKIQRRYLTAIENNDFDQLPGDFYVRAFIRQFADVVGLNGKELLADYKSEVPEAKPEEYVENSIDNKSEKIKETTNSRKGMWRSYLPQIATVVGVVLVILVVYIVYTRFFTGTNQQSANQAENVTVSSSRIKSSKSRTSSKKKSTPKSKTSEVKIASLGNNSYRVSGMKDDRTLTLGTTKNEVWAQILVNGSSVWQGTLKANGKHSVQLPQNVNSVSVQMGNSVSTTLTLAGKKVNAHNSTNPASPMTVRFTFSGQNSQTTSTQQSSATTQSSTTTNNVNTQTQQNQQGTQNTQNTQGQTNTNQNNGGQSNR
ncbi:helix-turn-helix domain-containing protein [Lactobacillus paragasseri]|jgi:xre family DNA-binding protein|uniref:helix-turn-helix domain-containing protein n=1 Tax=Lactobacillus paragasseri TaxID=2107999 RepID=UPI00254F2D4F|nr:RodZ domain-containing protein [Lactobacillus paragasseri]MDK7067788.1 helix-turn-helix domain-containing protein [Lactobacillus paragasseri]